MSKRMTAAESVRTLSAGLEAQAQEIASLRADIRTLVAALTANATAAPAPKGQAEVTPQPVAPKGQGRLAEYDPAAPKVQDDDPTWEVPFVPMALWAKQQPDMGKTAKLAWHGHEVTVELGYQQSATGWRLRKVTSLDGEAIHDHSSDARRKAVNGLLPCSVVGCPETRKGNNALCKTHQVAKRPAHKAWLAAGQPKAGTPEWRTYMGFVS